MSPEERSLLERTYKLAEENNKILLSMRRVARIHLVMRITYWVIIIAISVGAIYFIQPYFEFLTNIGDQSIGVNGINQQESTLEFLEDLLK